MSTNHTREFLLPLALPCAWKARLSLKIGGENGFSDPKSVLQRWFDNPYDEWGLYVAVLQPAEQQRVPAIQTASDVSLHPGFNAVGFV
jgi:hypothetical protein